MNSISISVATSPEYHLMQYMIPQPILPPIFEDIFLTSEDEDDDYEPPRIRIRRNPVIRERYDYFNNLNDDQFKLRFRLNKRTVSLILDKIAQKIEPKLNRNHAISPMNRLLLTLRFLATGYFFICAGDTMGISKTAAHDIIQLVVNAIVELRKEYIHFPSTPQGMRTQVSQFFSIARFPKVIGAIDCTHIRVQNPGGPDGWMYFNRKGYHSKNVQVVAGPDLKIQNIVTRWCGRYHDMSVFNASRLRSEFEPAIPPSRFGSYILLGDGGYECRKYLLTPLSNPATPAEQEYNTRLSSTRMTVERLFGIWKRRFPILSIGIRVSHRCQQRIDYYIVATAILHNIAILEKDPLPNIDPDVPLPQPEPIQDIHNIGPPPREQAGQDRLDVRNFLIQGHFTDLARRAR